MPEWLKKLFKLLKFDINASLIKTGKVVINSTHVVNKPDAPTVRLDKDHLEINIANLTPAQIESAKPIFREAFDQARQTFIASKTGEQIGDFKKIEASPQSQSILISLQSIISTEDYQALRAALFLRSQYDAGRKNNVHRLKFDIMQRFGERGRKISNLCTAGYFDNIPKQLEQAKKSPGFTQEKFRKSFDRFVSESAFALFVKIASSAQDTEKQILQQIKNNASYGLQRLVIHGISRENADKIRSAVDGIIKNYTEIAKSSEENVGESILIDLEFPSSIHEKIKF